MKQVATAALVLSFGVAAIYAQPGPVSVTVSGTAAASTVALQPGKPASEYQLVGNGALGPFTFRTVTASADTPQQSITCSGSTKLYVPVVAGGGVLRFEEGSLLKVFLTGGSDCIDFSAQQALCIRNYRITGGTGALKNASGGTVTLTMTVMPVLADASNNPVFFAVTGTLAGTFPAVAGDQRPGDGQQ